MAGALLVYPGTMHGLIGKMRSVEGKADELIEILTAGSDAMPGCLSYVVARDAEDENAIWITEVWVDAESHRASLALPQVQDAMARGRPLIAGFEQHVATTPVAASTERYGSTGAQRAAGLEPAAGGEQVGQLGQLGQLRDLHRHGVWADARMLTAVKAADGTAAEAMRELAHIRGAQETWLARIGERQATLPVWPELALEEIEREGARLDGAWAELLAGLAPSDLERTITYRNSRGEQSTSSLTDVATHVTLHAQYHRGKANAALRDIGAEAVNVDYITWRRLGSPEV